MKKIYFIIKLALLFFGISATAQTTTRTCDVSALDFSFIRLERPTTCPSFTAGNIEISVTNGVGPFTATISQIAAATGETLATIPLDLGATNSTTLRVRADAYEATITSANGCSVTKQLFLNPAVNFSLSLGDCTNDGRRELLITGTSLIPTSVRIVHRESGFVVNSGGVSVTRGASITASAPTGITVFSVTSAGCTTTVIANIPACEGDVTICSGVAPFVGTRSYSVGDLVVFNNNLVEITRVVGGIQGITVGSCDDVRSAKSLSSINNIINFEEVSASIYPNPFVDTLNITTNGNENYTVTIINLAGQTVYNNAFADAKFTADVSNLSTGIYFVSVVSATGEVVLSEKMVK